jgi:hypothetical protein
VKLQQAIEPGAARPVKGAFERLERSDAKVSRAVLRGRGGGNAALLPDQPAGTAWRNRGEGKTLTGDPDGWTSLVGRFTNRDVSHRLSEQAIRETLALCRWVVGT